MLISNRQRNLVFGRDWALLIPCFVLIPWLQFFPLNRAEISSIMLLSKLEKLPQVTKGNIPKELAF